MTMENQLLLGSVSHGRNRSSEPFDFKMILRKIYRDCKVTFYSSPVNYLLVFLPVGIALGHMNYSANWVFVVNFLSIIPLAAILSFATEELAVKAGSTLGGLLNATLGNAVELIVSIIALKRGQVRIVQASMLGSLLSNLLLVLGFCFLFGGYNRNQQKFNQTAAQTMSSLLAISCASLLIPAAFRATLPNDNEEQFSFVNDKILKLSRSTSLILLLVYVLFLYFQLFTHHKMFENEEDMLVDLTTDRNSGMTNISGLSGPILASKTARRISTSHLHQPENSQLNLGTGNTSLSLSNHAIEEDYQLSIRSSLSFLVISTVLVSICADFLVGSIDDIVSTSGLSKTFIGLIVIPIVGNAAEHVTSVIVAMKDNMSLALSVAIGSSLQISLFVTPFMVLIGWYIDVPMTLNFSTFETAILFTSVFLSNYLILDGESNWLEGVMSLAMYLLISLAFFYYPDEKAVDVLVLPAKAL